ncbi:MAG: hypothetical protein EOP83_20050 [Verrucomicrobiaceae bacterium]|nr:MAG: hypothetical protein EOP83_20050 [Verrucomicrobiaceae bacterium]
MSAIRICPVSELIRGRDDLVEVATLQCDRTPWKWAEEFGQGYYGSNLGTTLDGSQFLETFFFTCPNTAFEFKLRFG